MPVCRKCGAELTEENQYSWAKDNKDNRCKACTIEYQKGINKKWKENLSEEKKERIRRHQRNHQKERYHAPDGKIKAYLKKWHEEHPDYAKQKAEEWRKAHPDEVNSRNRARYHDPDSGQKEYQREYQRSPKHRAYQNEYWRRRRAEEKEKKEANQNA